MQNQNVPKRISPSYFRRQERRKAARATDDPDLVGGDTAEEATMNTKKDEKAEKALIGVQNNDKSEEDLASSSVSDKIVKVAE